jgi:hypothetical protein
MLFEFAYVFLVHLETKAHSCQWRNIWFSSDYVPTAHDSIVTNLWFLFQMFKIPPIFLNSYSQVLSTCHGKILRHCKIGRGKHVFGRHQLMQSIHQLKSKPHFMNNSARSKVINYAISICKRFLALLGDVAKFTLYFTRILSELGQIHYMKSW